MALSYFSGYSIHGSVGLINIEVVTMLTPIGMMRTFLEAEHWLRPYYQQRTVPTAGFFDNVELTAIYLLFALLSIYLLRIFRRGLDDSC